MMKKGKYILIMLSLFICAYLFSNRITPRIENIASKEINQIYSDTYQSYFIHSKNRHT